MAAAGRNVSAGLRAECFSAGHAAGRVAHFAHVSADSPAGNRALRSPE